MGPGTRSHRWAACLVIPMLACGGSTSTDLGPSTAGGQAGDTSTGAAGNCVAGQGGRSASAGGNAGRAGSDVGNGGSPIGSGGTIGSGGKMGSGGKGGDNFDAGSGPEVSVIIGSGGGTAGGGGAAGGGGSIQRDASVADARSDAPFVCVAQGRRCATSSDCCSRHCDLGNVNPTCLDNSMQCPTPCSPDTYCRPKWTNGTATNTCEPLAPSGCDRMSPRYACDRCLKANCGEELVAFGCNTACVDTLSCHNDATNGGLEEYARFDWCAGAKCRAECNR